MFTWRDKTLAYCSKYLTPGIKFCGWISLQNIFHQAQLLKQIKGNIFEPSLQYSNKTTGCNKYSNFILWSLSKEILVASQVHGPWAENRGIGCNTRRRNLAMTAGLHFWSRVRFINVFFITIEIRWRISFYSHFDSNTMIVRKFCTWHDSCAVVAWAKKCCDPMASHWRRSFSQIWITGKQPWLIWAVKSFI